MSFAVPKRLLCNPGKPNGTTGQAAIKQPKTVYTLRITTSPDRNATLSDTSSGVLVCLMNEQGDSLLRFLPCLESTTEIAATLKDICASGEIPPGADCSVIMGSPTPTTSPYSKHRFLSGAVTEVSFVGTNLGSLSAVIVGPQSGTWGCSEVVVSSSAEGGGFSSKFKCRDGSRSSGIRPALLGKDPLHSAAYLERVPQGAVVYGQGESAQILSSRDALEMAVKNMEWYDEMKKKLLFYTATVGCVGAGLAYISIGHMASLAFASGSMMSFWYQIGLQKKVDTIGKDTPPADEKESSRLLGALPLVGVSAVAWLVYTHPSLLGLGSVVSMGQDAVEIGLEGNFSLTMALLAGLLSQKVAVLIFSTEGVKYPLLDLEGKRLQEKQDSPMSEE